MAHYPHTLSMLPPTLLAVFGPLDVGVLLAYLLLMALVGAAAARRKTDARGYFLAERAMPAWAVALSVVATSLSVATFVGVPEQAFKGDLSYLVTNAGGFLAVFIVAGFFIPRFFRAGTITIYGFLEKRYGQTVLIAVSATFLLGRLLASGARLYIAARPVCLLIFHTYDPTRQQLLLAICLIGAIGTAYTIAGGIRAVIWTDTIQITIVAGAAILSIALLMHRIPVPFSGIVHALADPTSGPHGSKLLMFDLSTDPTRPFTLWTALIGGTFLSTAAYGVDHDLAQRMLTARSAWRGGLSLILSQLISVVVVCLFLAIGLLLYIFYKRPDLMGAAFPHDPLKSSADVYPQFLLNHLPTGLSGLAMAGMFAAAQGSLDSAINAMASSAVADLYWPLRRRLGKSVDAGAHAKAPRLAVAAMGLVLILFAVLAALRYDPKQNTLIDFALGVMSFAYTGLLGVFLTALFTRRGNTVTVLSALLAGVVVTTLLQNGICDWWTAKLLGQAHHLASFWWMPIGTGICFAICVSGAHEPAEEQGFPVIAADRSTGTSGRPGGLPLREKD